MIGEEGQRKEAEKLNVGKDYRIIKDSRTDLRDPDNGDCPTTSSVFGKIKPCPGIIVESRRASFIRRKSLDNSLLLDAQVAM